MSAAQMELTRPRPSRCPREDRCSDEELRVRIQSATHRGIQNLEIDSAPGRVIVTGTSPSYYLKQLVTHAVLTAKPWVRLDNEIRVAVGYEPSRQFAETREGVTASGFGTNGFRCG